MTTPKASSVPTLSLSKMAMMRQTDSSDSCAATLSFNKGSSCSSQRQTYGLPLLLLESSPGALDGESPSALFESRIVVMRFRFESRSQAPHHRSRQSLGPSI